MKKTFNFGKYAIGNEKIKNNLVTITIELRETEKGMEFSACGEVWNSKKTDIIMGGQCLDFLQKYLKHNKTFNEIYNLWKKYHLNGMHAWCECEHVENPSEKVKVYKLRYNELGKKLSKIRDFEKDFKQFIEVTEQGLKNVPMALYEMDEYRTLNKNGIEEKIRGWVNYNPVLSPEGLIGKPCEKCGAKYGHAWYFHAIPETDLNRIKELINS